MTKAATSINAVGYALSSVL